MTTEELIETFSNENGFQFGIDIVMQAIRPNALYCLEAKSGVFTFKEWDKNNELAAPTSQEIREEYIRHQAIKETLDYINRNK